MKTKAGLHLGTLLDDSADHEYEGITLTRTHGDSDVSCSLICVKPTSELNCHFRVVVNTVALYFALL